MTAQDVLQAMKQLAGEGMPLDAKVVVEINGQSTVAVTGVAVETSRFTLLVTTKETVAKHPIAEAASRLLEQLGGIEAQYAGWLFSVGHDQENTIYVHVKKTVPKGVKIPERFEGYDVKVARVGTIVVGPATPPRRR